MTNITISYTKNTKNKFDFTVNQDGVILYTKAYSPRTAEMQHYMGYAIAKTAQDAVDEELARNPEFKWHSFDEFKAWLGAPALRDRAVAYYHENEVEWTKNPAVGW